MLIKEYWPLIPGWDKLLLLCEEKALKIKLCSGWWLGPNYLGWDGAKYQGGGGLRGGIVWNYWENAPLECTSRSRKWLEKYKTVFRA
jgi:hypothetical protein